MKERKGKQQNTKQEKEENKQRQIVLQEAQYKEAKTKMAYIASF